MTARRPKWVPPDKRKPVGRLNAAELHAELLFDAERYVATPLNRFTDAVQRIAQLRRVHPEVVFQQIRADVIERTGRDLPWV